MREWLELTEKAVYLCNNENTYYTKNLDCRSYVGGKWSWLGLPNLMTGKGSKRWQQVNPQKILGQRHHVLCAKFRYKPFGPRKAPACDSYRAS